MKITDAAPSGFVATLRRPSGPLFFVVSAVLLAIWSALWPLSGGDLWWHMAVGKFADAWSVAPAQNMFLFTRPPGEPTTFVPWLADWWLFRLFDLGGGLGLVYLRSALLFVLGLLGMGSAMARTDVYQVHEIHRVALVMVIVGFVHGGLTPALFGALFAIFALHALTKFAGGGSVLWLAPVAVILPVWSHVDLSFFVPIVGAICGLVLGERRLSWAVAFIVFAVASCVSPRTYEVWLALGDVVMSGSQTIVQNANPGAWVAAAVYASIVGRSVFKWGTGIEKGLFVVMGIWGLWYQPHAILWAPTAAVCISSGISREGTGRAGAMGFLAALTLVAVAVVAQPFTQVHLDVRSSLGARKKPPEAGVLGADVPLEHVQLLSRRASMRVFHEREYAGPLAFGLMQARAPEPMLFVDPITDARFPELRELHAQVLDDPALWRGVFQQDKVNAVLIRSSRGLARMIVADPDWYVVFEERGVALLARRSRITLED